MVEASSVEEAAQQGDEGGADQGDTAAGHQLLDALGLRAGVIVAVAFKQVDDTPDTETGTDGNDEGLENRYSRSKKSHTYTSVL